MSRASLRLVTEGVDLDPLTRSAFFYGEATGSRGLGLYAGEVMELPRRKWALSARTADRIMLAAVPLALAAAALLTLTGAV